MHKPVTPPSTRRLKTSRWAFPGSFGGGGYATKCITAPQGSTPPALTVPTVLAVQNPELSWCMDTFSYFGWFFCQFSNQNNREEQAFCLCACITSCTLHCSACRPNPAADGVRVPGWCCQRSRAKAGTCLASALLMPSSAQAEQCQGKRGFSRLPIAKASRWLEDGGTGTFPGRRGSARGHKLSQPRQSQPRHPRAARHPGACHRLFIYFVHAACFQYF